MLCVHHLDFDEFSPDAAHGVRLRAANRATAILRSALVPFVAVPCVLLAFGSYALFTVTGIGPQSWQARLCTDDILALSSCGAASRGVDPSGMQPYRSVVRGGVAH